MKKAALHNLGCKVNAGLKERVSENAVLIR